MKAPDLTDTERLILANQYEIIAKLTPGENGYYTRLAENLRAGHQWLYRAAFESVSPVLDESDHELVYSILAIYGDMKASYDELDDKNGIEQREVVWPGFDGNNETELLSLTRALAAEGLFSITLPATPPDSHITMVDGYRRMIGRWEELGKPHYPYSKEKIRAILDARRRG